MLQRGRLLWKLLVALAAALALAALVLYQVVHHEPKFYREALQADAQRQREASDEMLQQATNLASDLSREGRWQAVFTAQQINGWLAVDLPQNHRDLLPEELRDPRVRIEEQRLLVGCHLRHRHLDTVISVILEPYMVRPNTLAIRVRGARAGGLPMPLRSMLDAVADALNEAQIQVEWRQADGDPVAIVKLAPVDRQRKQMQIESLQLSEGKITVAGTTHRRPAPAAPGATPR